MATKAKESTAVEKEKKKAPSSNSHITSTKRTTKPSTTTTATTSSTNKSNSTIPSSQKNTPNYLKPTISSRLESPSSFKQPKSESPIKPSPINRRRSFDHHKPHSSSSNSVTPKQKQPSLSRLHKALVSPGPRQRSTSSLTRSSTSLAKNTNPSKPISDHKTPKTTNDGKKTKAVYVAKATKKSTPNNNNIGTSTSSSSTEKVTKLDHAASANPTTIDAKSKDETKDVPNVETEEVKEVTNQEVEVTKAEKYEEHVPMNEISPHDVNSELHDQGNVEDEKVISTVSEEVEAEKEQPQEEKPEVEHEEEENNINNGNQPEEHCDEVEGEVVVKEKEGNEGGVVIEDQKSENNNEEEKEAVEGGIIVSEEVEEGKGEQPTQQKQESGEGGKGKNESQVSNDVIEETASKLLEGRKNKVLALAGAFQTVIDYQAPPK